MLAILQTTFSNAFSWKIIDVFWLKIRWNLFIGRGWVLIDNVIALVRVMVLRWRGDKPLPEPKMAQFTDTYKVCVARSQWVNIPTKKLPAMLIKSKKIFFGVGLVVMFFLAGCGQVFSLR